MAEAMDLFSLNDSSNDNGVLYVEGKVSTIFFESNDSFYKVILVHIIDTNLEWHEDEIVVTGSFGEIIEGNEYKFFGKVINHPKYGHQFQAQNYENNTPTSESGLIAYLSGDNFPGIGKKTAQTVVRALGTSAINQVLNDSNVLNQLGLSKKQVNTIIEGIKENNGTEQIIIGLNSYGFGNQTAAKIFNAYKSDTLDILKQNPYKMVEDIKGISFKKADVIAQKNGISFNDPGRIRAGLVTALNQLSIKNGDTYTTTEPLLNTTLDILNSSGYDQVDGELLAEELINLAKDGKIVGEDDRIYLSRLYNYEWQIAEKIKSLLEYEDTNKSDDKSIDAKIKSIEQKLHINYDQSQANALKAAINSQLFLLTGGPGTGKTTIIKGLVYLFAELNNVSLNINDYKEENFPILLAAPTGRAAKKMSESTGLPANTIHRLLGLNSYENDDVEQELEGSLLIVDEMSMVDVDLFKLLITSVPSHMKVILVGDEDQLPSVGPGQVFHDLLNSNLLPGIHLNNIYRQDANSTIIDLAHSVKNGEIPKDLTEKKPDRSFIQCSSSQMQSVINQIVLRAKQRNFNSNDMQVLAPMYRGEAGINRLNEIIQNIMNPKSDDLDNVEFRGTMYRVNDKVIQLVNSPENNIYNGDIGKIIEIEHGSNSNNDKITIAFDQNDVTYDRKDWEQFTLAYCTSIHKSQGSEFKMVILPIVPQFDRMLQRNLLYTAITRASDMLIMLGNYNSFVKCIQNNAVNRNTTLGLRIKKVVDKKNKATYHDIDNVYEGHKDKVLTNELINSNSIDPMIGMDGIAPSQFMKK
ncbi:ATP-dependent RecD-like DNA helicase [Apilactobacillus sp. TMW 2.2459]|uniref:SF1B family DNA helicase RecD2 n=1 Tax=Apilactobacillus xinyiensis TaxID=2841032 RepID=UPI00200DBC9D|nr:ATP-dependent RecD-like DNA helicase [Apilactobacillus xinyiensis]MCL0312401.1 ATP-dependent RecD-like DNA helicase [Apilactobacillus xinyiensis]